MVRDFLLSDAKNYKYIAFGQKHTYGGYSAELFLTELIKQVFKTPKQYPEWISMCLAMENSLGRQLFTTDEFDVSQRYETYYCQLYRYISLFIKEVVVQRKVTDIVSNYLDSNFMTKDKIEEYCRTTNTPMPWLNHSGLSNLHSTKVPPSKPRSFTLPTNTANTPNMQFRRPVRFQDKKTETLKLVDSAIDRRYPVYYYDDNETLCNKRYEVLINCFSPQERSNLQLSDKGTFSALTRKLKGTNLNMRSICRVKMNALIVQRIVNRLDCYQKVLMPIGRMHLFDHPMIGNCSLKSLFNSMYEIKCAQVLCRIGDKNKATDFGKNEESSLKIDSPKKFDIASRDIIDQVIYVNRENIGK